MESERLGMHSILDDINHTGLGPVCLKEVDSGTIYLRPHKARRKQCTLSLSVYASATAFTELNAFPFLRLAVHDWQTPANRSEVAVQ